MIEYLNRQAVADRLGLSINTVKWYDREGLMPRPDAVVGASPGWLPRTIDKWRESQPGKGARTDLAHKATGAKK